MPLDPPSARLRVRASLIALLLAVPVMVVAQLPSSGTACPTAKPKTLVAGVAVPTKAQYADLADKERQRATLSMKGPNASAMFTSFYGASDPAAGADAGLIYLSVGDIKAAVFTTAISAKRDPANAMTANNLGAVLQSDGALASALQALLYANALQPKHQLFLTNLGNTAFALGDSSAARRFYNGALEAAPGHSGALTGLGNLALCAGDAKGAERLFRLAMKDMFSPGARAGAEAASTVIGDDLPAQPGGGAPGNAKGAGRRAAGLEPFEPPGGRGGAVPIFIADPPILGDLKQTAKHAPEAERMSEEAQTRLGAIGQEMATVFKAAGRERAEPGVIPNRNEKEVYFLDDLRRIYAARIERRNSTMMDLDIADGVIARASRKLGELGQQMVPEIIGCSYNEGCIKKVELKYCKLQQSLYVDTHQRFVSQWNAYWTGTVSDLLAYDGVAQPWLEQMNDATAFTAQDLVRRNFILTHVAAGYGLAAGEAGMMANAVELDCAQFEDLPDTWQARQLKLEAAKKGPGCPKGKSLSISFSAVKFDLSCDKVKVEVKNNYLPTGPKLSPLDVGYGGFASLEYKFGKNGKSDRVTIFAGGYAEGGGSGLAEGQSSVKGSLRAGAYGSFDLGDPPSAFDVGLRGEATVSHENQLLKEPGGEVTKSSEVKTTVQLGVESGLTVDFSTASKIGIKFKGAAE